MSKSKLKGIGGKLRFLLDYSSLVIPVIIALVSITVLVLVPVLMGSGLKSQMESESVRRQGNKIRNLNKQTSCSEQWKIEKTYQDAYAVDANAIILLSEQSSRREFLSYRIFPEPKSSSMSIFEEFGRQYRDSIDALLERVNAMDCPSEAELEQHLSGYSPPTKGRRGSAVSDAVDDTIREELCRQKALLANIYINPVDLAGYTFWEEYEIINRKQVLTDCWYWQLGYWIIEDVIDVARTMNLSSINALSAPVKRIKEVSFAATQKKTGRRSGSRKTDVTGKPEYVFPSEVSLRESFTSRFSNDDIDVVNFNVCVVTTAKAVPSFMRELCSARVHKFKGFSGTEPEQSSKHNQITILALNIVPLDRQSSEHELYRYGDDAVVEVSLVCEYIFNRKGYEKIKPALVDELAGDF